MSNCKLVAIPSVINQKLSAKDGELCSKPIQYWNIDKSDNIYVINQVSQFIHKPRYIHMDTAKRILRYLKGTMEDRLVYRKGEDNVVGHKIVTYTNAD